MSKPITAADLPPHLVRFAETETAAEAFAALDRGEGILATPDEVMDGGEP